MKVTLKEGNAHKSYHLGERSPNYSDYTGYTNIYSELSRVHADVALQSFSHIMGCC